jgi:hypothetical protein
MKEWESKGYYILDDGTKSSKFAKSKKSVMSDIESEDEEIKPKKSSKRRIKKGSNSKSKKKISKSKNSVRKQMGTAEESHILFDDSDE